MHWTTHMYFEEFCHLEFWKSCFILKLKTVCAQFAFYSVCAYVYIFFFLNVYLL